MSDSLKSVKRRKEEGTPVMQVRASDIIPYAAALAFTVGGEELCQAAEAVLKPNLGVGVTEKAPNIAPEIGVMFRF